MNGRDLSPPLERSPRGGADAWDLGPSGALLTAELFGAGALPAGHAVGVSSGSSSASADGASVRESAGTSAGSSTAAATSPALTNNAIQFNGMVDPFCIGDDYYAQGLTPTPAYPLTAAVWAKLHTVPSGGNYGGIFSIEDGGGHSLQFNEIILDANSNTLVVFDHSGGGSLIGTVGTMTVGTWYKVALRLESGVYAAFLGPQGTPGVSKISGSITNVTAPGFSGLGSTMFRATEWFPGSLSRARVWTAALSDAEIAAEFTSDTAVRTADLFGEWLPPTITLGTESVAVVGTDLDQIRGGGSLLRTLDTGPTLDPDRKSVV